MTYIPIFWTLIQNIGFFYPLKFPPLQFYPFNNSDFLDYIPPLGCHTLDTYYCSW